jgi:spore maturation protein CgeB
MRVGVIGPLGPDKFATNIVDAARDAGHVAVPLGPLGPFQASHRPTMPKGRAALAALAALTAQALPRLEQQAHDRVVRAAAQAECEVVINIDGRLTPESVSALRRDGARVALWFPDSILNLGRTLMLLAPYDALFFHEPHLVNRLRATIDLPIHYLPQGCNPRHHRPTVPAGTEPHLVIAGNMYPSRVRLLERLAAKGIPVRVYGSQIPRWIGESPVRRMHAGRPVFTQEKARVFRSAAGVLNNLHPAEVEGVNMRLFEAAGCGAAVLSEFRPAIPALFADGEEVLTFRDFDELVAGATRLLTEPGLTGRLGDAAAMRAHREHTIGHRLVTILETIV